MERLKGVSFNFDPLGDMWQSNWFALLAYKQVCTIYMYYMYVLECYCMYTCIRMCIMIDMRVILLARQLVVYAIYMYQNMYTYIL